MAGSSRNLYGHHINSEFITQFHQQWLWLQPLNFFTTMKKYLLFLLFSTLILSFVQAQTTVILNSPTQSGNAVGQFNTVVGSGNAGAGLSTTAINNTFIGYDAGSSTTAGAGNTFVGTAAGVANVSGSNNTFLGTAAGYNSLSVCNNTLIGTQSGFYTTGSGNTMLGSCAGLTNADGNSNTFVGAQADAALAGLTNAAAIGFNAKVRVSNAIVLGDPANTSLNVGIGTDSPQFPLDVRGIINVRGTGGKLKFSALQNKRLRNGYTDTFLTVNEAGETELARYRLQIDSPSQWADRVFAPGYRLQPLAQVEEFIQQNGHLPGVPSADKVAKNGIDLVQMNALLLQKIEELTLHVIRLEKQVKQAKKR
jgi:trimeric autotransporter adhesin